MTPVVHTPSRVEDEMRRYDRAAEERFPLGGVLGPKLAYSEIFGPTFQGEGPSIGRLAYFVRLAGCNLQCTWCDTPYTWAYSDGQANRHRSRMKYDASQEVHRATWEDVLDTLERLGMLEGPPATLVLTGGEPLLQQDACVPLLRTIKGVYDYRVEVETAGTIAPHSAFLEEVDQFNVSLKLGSSGNELHARLRPEAITALRTSGKAIWKFVVTNRSDLPEIEHLVQEYGLHGNVWIMPEGTDADTITRRLQDLADPVLARGWNLTSRLHVVLWGNRRGV